MCFNRDADPVWGRLVDNLHVHPGARGSGIGERLLRDAAGLLSASASGRALHLRVFEANVAGLRFHTRLGGRVVETGSSPIPAAAARATHHQPLSA
ncbi:GNAT family N-acetyltransferase [Bradyrhizobium oligotrophicum S58]